MSRDISSAAQRNSPLTLIVVLAFFSISACSTVQGSGQPLDSSETTSHEITTVIPPTGGVALTFDDVYVDDWFATRDLLDSYGATATFFVTRFDRLSEDQLEKLRVLEEGGHEIASHGFRHLGVERDFESDKAEADRYLAEEVLPSIREMKNDGFRPESFAYPLGERTEDFDQLLLSQFGYLRGTAYPRDGLPVSEWDEIYFGCGHRDRVVFGVGTDESYGHSTAAIEQGFKRAAARNEVMVLYGHRITDGDGQYRTSPSRLEELLKAATNQDLEFFTISQLQRVDLDACDVADEDNS